MALLNMDWHREAGFYSDGPIEDEMLEIVRQRKNIDLVLEEDNRWPILYHFSPDRRNLLEWFPFQSNSSLLEIGAGCGALTGLFCEKTAHVSAVELSEKRSGIAFHRHRQAVNLEVIAGNIMDIRFPALFDYATLIGVLEYAGCFIKQARPAASMLKRVAGLLKPGGHLILAIENKFGLKYFAGACEEHTGRSFEGIEGYSTGRVETFSRNELTDIITGAGFTGIMYYYPYPDYKLPAQIFSDAFLPDINDIMHDSPNYDHDRLALFSEKKAFSNIIRDGCFPFFANSFLITARKNTGEHL